MSENNPTLEIAEEMCRFIREKSLNEHGLFRTERFNVDRLEWQDQRCDPDDFGDIMPFMVWFDDVTGTDDNKEWVNQLFSRMSRKLEQKNGFFTPYMGRKFLSYPINNIDLAWGCRLMYLMTGNSNYYTTFAGICAGVMRYAVNKNGFIRNCIISTPNLYFPSRGRIRYKPVVSGVYAELLSMDYAFPNYFSDTLINAFLRTKSYKKHGLVPDNVFPLTGKEDSISSLTKSNTSILSAMIRVYETNRWTVMRSRIAYYVDNIVKRFMNSNGSFNKAYNFETGRCIDKVTVGDNQAILDRLLDAYLVTKNKYYMRLAEKCAGFWLENQTYGLFDRDCDLDSQADMTVIMCKLYEMTGRKKYRESIKKSLTTFDGYKSENGSMYSKTSSSHNELKFFGGALKGILASHCALKHKKLLDSEKGRMLTWDR